MRNTIINTMQMNDLLRNAIPTQEIKLKLNTIFQWMPSCAIIIDTVGNLIDANSQALKFLGTSIFHTFTEKRNFNQIAIDFPRAMEMIHETINKNEISSKKILIKKTDKSVHCISINACQVPDLHNYILIQFTCESKNNQQSNSPLIQSFKTEILRLKPYLNKPGKDLIEEIIAKNSVEKSTIEKSNSATHLDILSEQRIKIILELLPHLTNSELVLCGFLSLRMSIEEISSLTGKTANCLRVSFHRILHKTDFACGRDLIREIESKTN